MKTKIKAGWEFIFLGANIDAVETASRFGIDKDHTADFHADEIGIGTQFEAVDAAIRSSVPQENSKGAGRKPSTPITEAARLITQISRKQIKLSG